MSVVWPVDQKVTFGQPTALCRKSRQDGAAVTHTHSRVPIFLELVISRPLVALVCAVNS